MPDDKNPNRNLTEKPSTRSDGKKRPFQARYVIDLGYAKTRIVVPLKTRDIEKARERRDWVEEALTRAARAYQGMVVDG